MNTGIAQQNANTQSYSASNNVEHQQAQIDIAKQNADTNRGELILKQNMANMKVPSSSSALPDTKDFAGNITRFKEVNGGLSSFDSQAMSYLNSAQDAATKMGKLQAEIAKQYPNGVPHPLAAPIDQQMKTLTEQYNSSLDAVNKQVNERNQAITKLAEESRNVTKVSDKVFHAKAAIETANDFMKLDDNSPIARNRYVHDFLRSVESSGTKIDDAGGVKFSV